MWDSLGMVVLGMLDRPTYLYAEVDRLIAMLWSLLSFAGGGQ